MYRKSLMDRSAKKPKCQKHASLQSEENQECQWRATQHDLMVIEET
jgi:hypothetical protein